MSLLEILRFFMLIILCENACRCCKFDVFMVYFKNLLFSLLNLQHIYRVLQFLRLKKKHTKRRRLTISIWSEATKSNFSSKKKFGGKKMAGKIWRQKNVVTCQKNR
jgi:hypothetical protein